MAMYIPGREAGVSPHDNRMSKQFVNNVASVAILATYWHEVPLPPLEGEVGRL